MTPGRSVRRGPRTYVRTVASRHNLNSTVGYITVVRMVRVHMYLSCTVSYVLHLLRTRTYNVLYR